MRIRSGELMTFETPQFVDFDQFTIYALRRGWIFQLQDFPPVDVEIVEITKVIWLRSTGITPPRLTFVSSETGVKGGAQSAVGTMERARLTGDGFAWFARTETSEQHPNGITGSPLNTGNGRKSQNTLKRAILPARSISRQRFARGITGRHIHGITRSIAAGEVTGGGNTTHVWNGAMGVWPPVHLPYFTRNYGTKKKKKIGTTLVQLCLLRVKK